MANQPKVLFASRAIESPPREGGFVLLSDLAKNFADAKSITPASFSCSSKEIIHGIEPVKVFSKPGWNARVRLEFMLGLLRRTRKFDIVHTAHIPTPLNCSLIRLAAFRARRSGTLFVQTVTGLPDTRMPERRLKKLLWGDIVVCQSEQIFKNVNRIRPDAQLITPWPPTERVKFDSVRRSATRKNLSTAQNLVVFPGEFDRLGVDASFAECLEAFFKNTDDAAVVLACRFDKLGRGQALVNKFPGRVISLGETGEIIELLEAADLVIYPVKTLNSKFQPPLVISEALQLGTPVLASSKIDLGNTPHPDFHAHELNEGWESFGKKMAALVNAHAKRQPGSDSAFAAEAAAYKDIYLNLRDKKTK